jgi:hypothetical protein
MAESFWLSEPAEPLMRSDGVPRPTSSSSAPVLPAARVPSAGRGRPARARPRGKTGRLRSERAQRRLCLREGDVVCEGARTNGSTSSSRRSTGSTRARSGIHATARSSPRAEIVEESRVESLDDLDADRVVIATDGYTSGLVPELDQAIRPVRGQVIASDPVGRALYPCPHLRAAGLRLLAAGAGHTPRPRRPA